MRSLLITGAAGFLGQHLRQAFLRTSKPWHIVLTDHLPMPAGQTDALPFVQTDLSDGPAIADILRDYAITHIVHAAARSSNIESAGDVLERNLVPALTLLEACASYWASRPGLTGHFHFVSCADVLQANENGVVSDDSALGPSCLFTASKGAIESLLLGFAARHHFQATLSYPTQFYGPGQTGAHVVPTSLDALLSGKRVPLFGDGRAVSDLLHGADAALAICAIVERSAGGRRYGIRGTPATAAEILATLCRCIDQRAPATPDFARRYDKSPAAVGKSSAGLITRVQDRRALVRPRKYLFGAISEVLDDYYPRSLYNGLLECVSAYLASPGAQQHAEPQPQAAVAF